jgi:hypothetical protein
MKHHRLYQVYQDMMLRCYDPDHPAYKYYGARGIQVCSDWQVSRENFFAWALKGWAQGLFLDRENNDKGYSPENCRWITPAVSNRNRSCTKLDLPSAAIIYDLSTAGVNQALIGASFDISSKMVSRIKVGKAWLDAPTYLAGDI